MVERCLNWTAEACSLISGWACRPPRSRSAPTRLPGGAYLFEDDFDGPAGSPQSGELDGAELAGSTRGRRSRSQYRDDRQNVFLDGNSNLVIRATGKTTRTSAARCAGTGGCRWATPGRRASSSTAWYRGLARVLGRQRRPAARRRGGHHWSSTATSTGPGTTVHAASNGKTWESKIDCGLGRRCLAQLADALGRERVQVLAGLRRRRQAVLHSAA